MAIVVIAIVFVLGGVNILLHPDPTPAPMPPDPAQQIVAVLMILGGSIVLLQAVRGVARLRQELKRVKQEPRDPR